MTTTTTSPWAQPSPAEPQGGALAVLNSEPEQRMTVFGSIHQFEGAQRMAAALCSSTIVPKDYQGQANLGNCLIALDMAGALALRPMTVMQNLHVINGKPSFGSSFLIGLINTCGRFSPLEFVLDDPTNPTNCYAVATSSATGRELVGELVTIEMAKAQGWWSRSGSKWPSMTGQMLRYRAAAFWQRVYAPELTLGMRTMEEAQDLEVVSVTVEPAAQASAPEPKSKAKARAKSNPAPDSEPGVVEPKPVAAAPASPPDSERAAPEPETVETEQPENDMVTQGLAAVVAEVHLAGMEGLSQKADQFLADGAINESEHARLANAIKVRTEVLAKPLSQFEAKSAVAKLQGDSKLEQMVRNAFKAGTAPLEEWITQRQHVETLKFFIQASQ